MLHEYQILKQNAQISQATRINIRFHKYEVNDENSF